MQGPYIFLTSPVVNPYHFFFITLYFKNNDQKNPPKNKEEKNLKYQVNLARFVFSATHENSFTISTEATKQKENQNSK